MGFNSAFKGLIVITASGFINYSCNYNYDAPDDERKYRSKHVQQPRNNEIINYPTRLHLVGHFYKNCTMMHGTMSVKKSYPNYCQKFISSGHAGNVQ
jgi:hypothetical protein